MSPTAHQRKETLHLESVILNAISFLWSFFSKKGTKAPQAAGKIHTDFEKGFIMAEVMKYEDFKEEGSENAVKVRNYFPVAHFIIFTNTEILMIKMNNGLLNYISGFSVTINQLKSCRCLHAFR